VTAQIAVLLALTNGLFDPVPVERMAEAERAVQTSAADLPAEVVARFDTAARLSEEDQRVIVDRGREVLARFCPAPEATENAATQAPATPGAQSAGTERP
jgi:F-type H+-transporting ATPase subunit alpha